MTYAGLEILGQAIERAGTIDKAAVIAEIKKAPFKTVIGEVNLADNINHKVWTVGQWQDGSFNGVASDGIAGAKAPVKKERLEVTSSNGPPARFTPRRRTPHESGNGDNRYRYAARRHLCTRRAGPDAAIRRRADHEPRQRRDAGRGLLRRLLAVHVVSAQPAAAACSSSRRPPSSSTGRSTPCCCGRWSIAPRTRACSRSTPSSRPSACCSCSRA